MYKIEEGSSEMNEFDNFMNGPEVLRQNGTVIVYSIPSHPPIITVSLILLVGVFIFVIVTLLKNKRKNNDVLKTKQVVVDLRGPYYFTYGATNYQYKTVIFCGKLETKSENEKKNLHVPAFISDPDMLKQKPIKQSFQIDIIPEEEEDELKTAI